jgi:hypothetical protein
LIVFASFVTNCCSNEEKSPSAADSKKKSLKNVVHQCPIFSSSWQACRTFIESVKSYL